MKIFRYSIDIVPFSVIVFAAGVLYYNWNLDEFNPYTFVLYVSLNVQIASIVHNHHHAPMFRSKWMNLGLDYWFSLLYGLPSCTFIWVHNQNHHVYNNKLGDDVTSTLKVGDKKSIWGLIQWFFVCMPEFFQYIIEKFKSEYKKGNTVYTTYKFLIPVFITYLVPITLLSINFNKTVICILLPQLLSLLFLSILNYVLHLDTQHDSKTHVARNFTGKISNFLFFNNGLHTVHHHEPSLHWSHYKERHEKFENQIPEELKEKNFFLYLLREFT